MAGKEAGGAIVPDWALKLMRRIMGLEPGRWMIVLTVGREYDWSVTNIGRVEHTHSVA